MTKKRWLILLCFVLGLPAYAQKNRVEVGLGGYRAYHVMMYDYHPYTLAKLQYSRKILKSLSIGASFSFTQRNYTRSKDGFRFMNYYTIENYRISYSSLGKITERVDYYFFDLYGSYAKPISSNQAFRLFAGPTMAYGGNNYLTKLNLSPPPYNDLGSLEIDKRYEAYFGFTAGLGYDYFLWQKRINVGADCSAKCYLNNFPFQLNYGLHVGYNF